MQTYLETVRVSLLVFPILAILSLLPFVYFHYKKHGYVDGFRATVLYAFLFYSIAAWLMTVLPLPNITENFCQLRAANTTPRLIPFQFITEMMEELGGNLSISRILGSNNFMVTAFNVLLLFPLGFFLNYLYKFKLWQAVGIGFLVSLFFEITQITGMYGLYPCPYRLFEVDDLMTNTTGTLLGYLFASYATFLPSTEVRPLLNQAEVTRTRRFLAFMIDIFIVGLFTGNGESNSFIHLITSTFVYLGYFVGLPQTRFGTTVGKKLLGLKVVNSSEKKASILQLLIRYSWLLIFPILTGFITNYFIATVHANGIYGLLHLVLLLIWFISTVGLVLFRKDKKGVHDILAKTEQVVAEK